MSSLEALESCFAVGPIIEKASSYFIVRGRFLKRRGVSGVVRGPENLKNICSIILIFKEAAKKPSAAGLLSCFRGPIASVPPSRMSAGNRTLFSGARSWTQFLQLYCGRITVPEILCFALCSQSMEHNLARGLEGREGQGRVWTVHSAWIWQGSW